MRSQQTRRVWERLTVDDRYLGGEHSLPLVSCRITEVGLSTFVQQFPAREDRNDQSRSELQAKLSPFLGYEGDVQANHPLSREVAAEGFGMGGPHLSHVPKPPTILL